MYSCPSICCPKEGGFRNKLLSSIKSHCASHVFLRKNDGENHSDKSRFWQNYKNIKTERDDSNCGDSIFSDQTEMTDIFALGSEFSTNSIENDYMLNEEITNLHHNNHETIDFSNILNYSNPTNTLSIPEYENVRKNDYNANVIVDQFSNKTIALNDICISSENLVVVRYLCGTGLLFINQQST